MKEAVYGFPCVQDPHDFEPDLECCSPAEVEAHRLACETYGTDAYKPNVARTSWGIGTNMVEMDEDEISEDDYVDKNK